MIDVCKFPSVYAIVTRDAQPGAVGVVGVVVCESQEDLDVLNARAAAKGLDVTALSATERPGLVPARRGRLEAR